MMERRKRIDAPQLPEVIIQHIQSFLSGKQAARTTILSKSWYNAWLIRPNLHFDIKDFVRVILFDKDAFFKFAKKTLQRYDELNSKIQSFRLSLNVYELAFMSPVSILREELIVKAMKLGATDVCLDNRGLFSFINLPSEVLESETLVRLSLIGAQIDSNHKVSCSRLKFFSLSRGSIEANVILEIIGKCPLIEEFLVLSHCKGSYDYSTRSYRELVLQPRLGANDFHNLKVLSLEFVEIGEWLFGDLSSKFPCLKELTLMYCTGYKEIQIYSNSLECIVLYQRTECSVMFDVPRIRKFKFDSAFVPSLSFKTTSRDWESDIYFTCSVDSSWFVQLRDFLLELSSSKIHLYLNLNLSIKISFQEGYEYVSHMIGLPKPLIIEKLRFLMNAPSLVQSSLLEDLFWSCRPKFIILHWSPNGVKNYDVVKLICHTLTEEECEKRKTSALYDLEEVKVEVSGHTPLTWRRPLPNKILDASELSAWIETKISLQPPASGPFKEASGVLKWFNEISICLHLRWGENF